MSKNIRIINKLFYLFLSELIFAFSIIPSTYSHYVNYEKIKNDDTYTEKSLTKKHFKKIGMATGLTVTGGLGIGLLLFKKINLKNQTAIENTYTPKKKENVWCWAACLEGLYKYYNINNVDQENIAKLFSPINPLYFSRLKKSDSLANKAMSHAHIKSINNLNDKFNFSEAIIDISENFPETLNQYILAYYNSINKCPFAISINNDNNIIHYVNIIRIKNNIVTTEDPLDGISRDISLNDFCNSIINTSYLKTNFLKCFTLTQKSI